MAVFPYRQNCYRVASAMTDAKLNGVLTLQTLAIKAWLRALMYSLLLGHRSPSLQVKVPATNAGWRSQSSELMVSSSSIFIWFCNWLFITNTDLGRNGVVERSHEDGKPSSCVAG